jgi:hypothetical protein
MKFFKKKGYKIFISYSWQDSDKIIPLVDLIKLNDPRIFRDKDSIKPGSLWKDAITDAIEKCKTFVLFWSKNSANSSNVAEEYTKALKLNKVVVPTLLDDTQLPPVLAEIQYRDLRSLFSQPKHSGGPYRSTFKIPSLLDFHSLEYARGLDELDVASELVRQLEQIL